MPGKQIVEERNLKKSGKIGTDQAEGIRTVLCREGPKGMGTKFLCGVSKGEFTVLTISELNTGGD